MIELIRLSGSQHEPNLLDYVLDEVGRHIGRSAANRGAEKRLEVGCERLPGFRVMVQGGDEEVIIATRYNGRRAGHQYVLDQMQRP
jgi:hypothetical protein